MASNENECCKQEPAAAIIVSAVSLWRHLEAQLTASAISPEMLHKEMEAHLKLVCAATIDITGWDYYLEEVKPTVIQALREMG